MSTSSPGRRRRGSTWLHPGWSWTVGRVWVITALSTSVSLIFGAVLGALPALLAGSWRDAQTREQVWILVGLSVAGVAAGGIAVGLYRKRRWVLQQNGTAYVIQELVGDWDRQQEKAFLESAGRHFARVIQVPGPGQLGRPWDWPLNAEARKWDSKVDELIRAFQALRSADDPATPNGMLMWCSWAVSVAFGLRVSAADRDLQLDVWQRPSHGRAGNIETVIGAQRPHRFGYDAPVALADLLRSSAPQEFVWPARLETEQLNTRDRSEHRRRVSVLLLRFSYQGWGPLPAVGSGPAPIGPRRLRVSDAAGVIPAWSPRVTIRELRCLPPPCGQFPWPAVPALVTAAADWVERTSASLTSHTLLLGAVMPPETALGLGIVAGHPQRTRWPQHLWPLVYETATGSLAVPRLDLGSRWDEG